MADRRPLRERPKLLLDIDLSKEVSEDLRIVTTPPSLKAGPQLNGATLSSINLASAGLSTARRRKHGRASGLSLRKPPPGLVSALLVKISKVLPPGGDLCFTLVNESDEVVGKKWVNHWDSMFYLASPHQIDYSINEWANAEYEWICDSFSNEEEIRWPYQAGTYLAPTPEILMEAWDAVATNDPSTEYDVQVFTEDGAPLDSVRVTAYELMTHYGLSPDALKPTVVIADYLRHEDLEALMSREDDAEVYCDEGYVVTWAGLEHDIPVVHIEPGTPTK